MLVDHIRAAARESAGKRGTDDIEPNASNKANIMELMTGCVPLTLVTRSRLRSIPLSVKRREEYVLTSHTGFRCTRDKRFA